MQLDFFNKICYNIILMRKIFGTNDQGHSGHNHDLSLNGNNNIHEGIINGTLSAKDVFPDYASGDLDEMPEGLIDGILKNKRSKLSEWGVSILPHVGFEDHRKRINEYGLELQRQMQEIGYSEDTTRWARVWMFTRFQDRCKLNHDKYSAATGEVPQLLHHELGASIKGEASPVTLLAIKSFRGMDSIELGRVTLPATRKEVVQDMDAAIKQAIDLTGGEACEPGTEFSIAETRQTSDGKFVYLITAKERMAILADGTIVAKRYTCVVETASEINPDEVARLFDDSDSDQLPPAALSVICYAYSKPKTQ